MARTLHDGYIAGSKRWESAFLNGRSIHVSAKNYRCFTHEKPLKLTLSNGISAYVGQNNTGKSTILKFLWEIRPIFQAFLHSSNFQRLIRENDNKLEVTWPDTNRPPEGMFNDNDPHNLPVEIEVLVNSEGQFDDLDGEVKKIKYIINRNDEVECLLFSDVTSYPLSFSDKHLVDRANACISETNDDDDVLSIGAISTALRILFKSSYFASFRFAEGGITKGQYYDSSVGTSFIQRWKQLKNGTSKDGNRKAKAIVRKIAEIFQFDSFDLSASHDDQHFRVVINDSPERLDQVGSGITQAIMLLTYCEVEEPTYILVDEPELNLHHDAQIKLIKALEEKAEYGVIFATHNLGLARRCADTITCVTRKSPADAPIVMPYEDHPYLADIYQSLTYSGYFGYDAKKILLVEGPTDVKVFKHFLKLYNKDHEFMLINLGGGSMINGKRTFELEELQRLNKEITVIIDSERTRADMKLPRDRLDFINIVKRLGFKHCVLRRKATENYLSQNAVDEVIGNDCRSLGEYERLDESHPWSKEKNHKIAQAMKRIDLDETDLGQFFASL